MLIQGPRLSPLTASRKANRIIRLTIFDLDGTLTDNESAWQYLHKRLGTWKAGLAAFEQYQRREISYEQWASLDAKQWVGQPISRIRSIIAEIPYSNGAKETVSRLKQNGLIVGIVSGGISLLAERVKNDLKADFAVANVLEDNSGVLNGRVKVLVNPEKKSVVIRKLARKLGVTLQQVAAVGDKHVDLPSEVGLKVAFNPKDEEAKTAADVVIVEKDLRNVLPYILRATKQRSTRREFEL